MATKKKMLMSAAGSAGGAGLDIDEVFSTYLYEGTSAAHTITNGIDLAGEGGLVWTKVRTQTDSHYFWDTERGVNKRLSPNQPYGENNETDALNSFNSNGFTMGSAGNINGDASGHWGGPADYVSWTFRKTPKFFDIVTYSGDGSNSRAISHSLGSIPGTVIIKRLDSSTDWMVYHRGVNGGTNPANYYLTLNGTDPAYETASPFNNTVPTSSVFSVGGSANTNHSSGTYVAYIFAHNDGDGGFGPTGDQDIIKCGSYTGNGSSTGPVIDLGFEPQWLMIKGATIAKEWRMFDTMRGMPVGGSGAFLEANSTIAEGTDTGPVALNADGFQLTQGGSETNNNGDTYIYMAIRRGPLAPPTAGTEVFDVEANSSNAITTGFPVDWRISKRRSGSAGYTASRLTGNTVYNATESTSAEFTSGANFEFDSNTGVVDDLNGGSDPYVRYAWKRAPSFFDAVAYTGNSTAGRTVSHNLGVVPEMIWVKVRNLSSGWPVWHTGKELYLNLAAAKEANPLSFNNTDPTATSFTLNSYNSVNGSGYNYIAYLFASLPGISKVGSYTGTGSTQTIDCGFSSGARFVLIKCTNDAENWIVFDSARGIVSGNDPYLSLNTTDAENTNSDFIDPASSGFIVNSNAGEINNSNNTYIFYAIA